MTPGNHEGVVSAYLAEQCEREPQAVEVQQDLSDGWICSNLLSAFPMIYQGICIPRASSLGSGDWALVEFCFASASF